MGFFQKVSDGISGHFEKQRQDKEKLQAMRRESEMNAQIVFEQDFRKGTLEVARAKAHRDAAKLSGVQKLRAMSRARNLSEPGNQQNIMSKLSAFTQRNLQKREENLKRTEELRTEAEKMKKEKLSEQQLQRVQRMGNTAERVKPFGQRKSTWKM